MSTRLNNQQKDPLLPFFLLTFLITWGFGALAIFLPAQFQALFGELTDTSPIYFLAIAARTISATIITFARDGWSGLRSLYARLIRWRFGIQGYALVLIGIQVLGWIAARFTESNPLKETNNLTQFLWLLFYLLITGPLCEELGWRGFALPRLLNRFTPFSASLILGMIWGVWHLPSFFLGGMVQNAMSLLIFILFTPCLAILMTWFFQHTATINLALASKAYAFIRRRGYVVPEDVRAVCHDVMRHRIAVTYEAEAENVTSEQIIDEILNAVEVP